MITDKVDPIMQYGVASARIEEKIELMKLGPDMMAVASTRTTKISSRCRHRRSGRRRSTARPRN